MDGLSLDLPTDPPLSLSLSLPGYLANLLPSDPVEVRQSGARRWWGGPLDIEGLALGSAEAFVAALTALTPTAEPTRFTLDSSAVPASFGSLNHLRVDGSIKAGFAPLSGFHRTADGWIRLHANYPHHERALLSGLGVSTPAEVREQLASLTSSAAEEAVIAHGGVAAAVQPSGQWLSSPSSEALAAVPWIRVEMTDVVPRREFVPGPGMRPLAGIRVLDLTRVIAGPSASRLLGALGADVLRVDPPAIPELWHQHVDTGFDKRSAVADLRDSQTRARIHALLNDADIVLLGYRQASLLRFGFDSNSLRERHPHLIVVTLDAWGTTGPNAHRRGFDSIVQAATGISHLYGTGEGDDWRPGALPVQALDHATGLGMGAAALALLYARREGRTGSAHLSLARTALELLQARPASDPVVPLPAPKLREMPSAYGALQYVPPPVVVDGIRLDYTEAPVRYGSSELSWREAWR